MKKFEFYKKNHRKPFYVIDKMNSCNSISDAEKLFRKRIKEGSFAGIYNEKEIYIIKQI